MVDQYTRTALLIGRKKIDILKTKRVAIFGLGGVGGNALESLARFGIGKFDLIDNDVFSISNINRQLLATYETVSKYKVDVAKKRVESINPSAEVRTYKTFYLPTEKEKFNFKDYDYIVDAIDTVTAKIDIIMEAKRCDVPIISAMGCGNRLDPTKLRIDDIYKTSEDPLSKVIRHELRKRKIDSLKVVYSLEKPVKVKEISEEEKENSKKRSIPGSTSFVPPAAGILIGYTVITDLLKDI